MSSTPKVSVILTSYNHGKYLQESIKSVLNQTYSDFELIIWDDGSTDESWEIIQGYSDPRIRAFRNETGQYDSPIRSAFPKILTTSYIAIQHSDDIWEPEKLEKQINFLDTNPEIGVVFTWAQPIDETGQHLQDQNHFYYKIFEQPNRNRFEWLNFFFLHGNALCHPSVMLHKQCYDDCGLYRYGLTQTGDFDMWVRLCLKGEIHVLPEKLVRFRVRGNEKNVSGNRPETRIRGQFEFLQVLNNYRKISSFDELKKIFPSAKKYERTGKEDLGFVLGMIALEAKPYRFTELFGLTLLFEALNDPDRARDILEFYKFGHAEYIKLTAKHDVFSLMLIENLTTQVNETEQSIQMLLPQAGELAEIKSSTSWKLVLVLQKIRETLLPIGSRRERLMYLMVRAFHILKDEGIRALLKIIYLRISRARNTRPLSAIEQIKINSMISIVIPVYNAASFTKNCIEQIYKVSTDLPFEVIVVDNCSKDETRRLLKEEQKKRKDFKFYRMSSNLGFAGAVNYGCRRARGNYIVILNNDTLVTPGWLDRLIDPFRQDESIGIVSPVTNYVGEGPQIDSDAINISPEEIESYAEKIIGRTYIHEPNRLVFFCVAIKREVLDIVGDLDIGYEKGNFEDDDYCMRTIMAGFQLAIAPGSFVYHFGTMTFKKNRISHSEFMGRNRKRFFQKAQNIAVITRPPTPYSSDIKVSVIVRTLNRAELLQRALTSLANQTFKGFEVVLVNDGGKDVSNLLNKFKSYYPLTYVYNDSSMGRTAALNSGVRNSKGKWIGFLDDDDIVYPWHLDTLISATQKNNNANVFYSNYNQSLFTSSKDNYPENTIGVEPWEINPQKLLVQNYLPIHTWLVSRHCFDRIGLFDENLEMLEDFEFLVRLSKDFQFFHVKRYTCEYRYYLDGVNSMAMQRAKTLDALRLIYEQNPVYDLTLVNARKLQLSLLETQIRKIEELNTKLNETPEDAVTIYRKIVHLITGL